MLSPWTRYQQTRRYFIACKKQSRALESNPVFVQDIDFQVFVHLAENP